MTACVFLWKLVYLKFQHILIKISNIFDKNHKAVNLWFYCLFVYIIDNTIKIDYNNIKSRIKLFRHIIVGLLMLSHNVPRILKYRYNKCNH